MRTLGLLLTLVVLAPQASTAQRTAVPEGATIASVDVSGFDRTRLSPGLRDAIEALVGSPLKQETLDDIAARIEAERPRYVAAARAFMDPDGAVRVVFMVGRARASEQQPNVNTRYIVERAEITGVPADEIDDSLQRELQSLVDLRLDSPEAAQIEREIRRSLSRYDISRRIVRGSEPGRIQLVYEARRSEESLPLRFLPVESNVIFHADHGWGSRLEFPLGGRHVRFTPLVAISDKDSLIEEYSGFGIRFETRKLVTDRLGFSLEWTGFEQDWEAATIDALAPDPRIPAPYEHRTTVTPLLRFAITPQVTLSGGVSITELDPLDADADSIAANAVVAAIDVRSRTRDAWGGRHDVYATFGVRRGAGALESDLTYTRYLGEAAYRFRRGRHRVEVTGTAGGITGDAPLFERFSLGNSRTLRGWDKYAIAPAGGDRVFHSSIEYRFSGAGAFLDVGSVWDEGAPRKMRASTGLAFRAGPAFLTVGFPLNTDDVRAVVSLGIRLNGGAGGRW